MLEKNKPLEASYLIVWMYGIIFKGRENSKVINKIRYIAVGLRVDVKKESSPFWMSILTDIKARGTQDK